MTPLLVCGVNGRPTQAKTRLTKDIRQALVTKDGALLSSLVLYGTNGHDAGEVYLPWTNTSIPETFDTVYAMQHTRRPYLVTIRTPRHTAVLAVRSISAYGACLDACTDVNFALSFAKCHQDGAARDADRNILNGLSTFLREQPTDDFTQLHLAKVQCEFVPEMLRLCAHQHENGAFSSLVGSSRVEQHVVSIKCHAMQLHRPFSARHFALGHNVTDSVVHQKADQKADKPSPPLTDNEEYKDLHFFYAATPKTEFNSIHAPSFATPLNLGVGFFGVATTPLAVQKDCEMGTQGFLLSHMGASDSIVLLYYDQMLQFTHDARYTADFFQKPETQSSWERMLVADGYTIHKEDAIAFTGRDLYCPLRVRHATADGGYAVPIALGRVCPTCVDCTSKTKST